jgi:predicted metal-dependent phosphoesterase TrpH
MLKVDFHIHTSDVNHEFAVKHDAKMLIDRAAELKFDAIAITLHDYLLYTNEIKKYADSKNILLIPGMEKTIEGKHVLLLNIDKPYKNIIKLKQLRRMPPEVLVIAAHPFYPMGTYLGDFLQDNYELFDAIEYSSCYPFFYNGFNRKAQNFAQSYNVPLVGNSDTHILGQFGHTYTMVNTKKNILDIVKAVKNNKVMLVTKPLPFFTFSVFVIRVMAIGFLKMIGKDIFG